MLTQTSRLDESFESCSALPKFLRNTDYRKPSPGKTAFNYHYDTDLDFYAYCATVDTQKGSRFARAMIQVAQSSLVFFEAAYPFSQIETAELIIDIAGGIGQASVFLAERLPNPTFVISDFPSVVDQGKAQCPTHLASRLQYVAHDFFQPFDVQIFQCAGPRVFLLKQILHDWSDEEASQILLGITSVLGPRDRLLILDTVKPDGGKTSHSTAMSDLLIMSTFGGLHRTFGEFEDLVRRACPAASMARHYANAGQQDDFLVLEVRKQSR